MLIPNIYYLTDCRPKLFLSYWREIGIIIVQLVDIIHTEFLKKENLPLISI